jgi:NitT/TauT family transport system substrate-binding protein
MLNLPVTRHLIAALALAAAWVPSLQAAEPLKIGYSDYISYVAWEVAIQKGWFKEAGVDVSFVWFEYAPSMEAFQAGKIDAVNVASTDQLVMAGASKKPSKATLITDYSNGNDKVIAKAGITSLKDLKGKKVGVEVGLVDHLLLLKALESVGMTMDDIVVVNMVTTDTPQGLASGSVDAVACWQPNANATLKLVPGSKALFTSADVPGLIYDVLAVSDESLAAHRADWAKVNLVWERCVSYIADPKTQADAVAIMAAKNGVDPKEYAAFVPGSKLHSLADNRAALVMGKPGFGTLFGAHVISDEFNRAVKVYDAKLDVAALIDGTLVGK